MKFALFSDIHANRQAFDACMEHAQGAGVEGYAFTGDLVGYGADPAYVVQRVMALAAQGALVVRGNHDHLAAVGELAARNPEKYAGVEDDAHRRVGYAGVMRTREQLGPEKLRFLADLPLTLHAGSLLLVHASADAPANWRYVDNPSMAALSLDAACEPPHGHEDVRYVFGGHVHLQTLYFRGGAGKLMPFAPTPGVPIPVPRHRHWLATVGSVGQPRDGRPEAMYALFDDAAQRLTFYRVPYDVQAAAAAIRAAGMPAFFADRLEIGR